MRRLRCIVQAVVANSLEALASGLVEIADAWKRYREQPAKNATPPCAHGRNHE